jgi:hypothetical protein
VRRPTFAGPSTFCAILEGFKFLPDGSAQISLKVPFEQVESALALRGSWALALKFTVERAS